MTAAPEKEADVTRAQSSHARKLEATDLKSILTEPLNFCKARVTVEASDDRDTQKTWT